jgi:hypothetical protein
VAQIDLFLEATMLRILEPIFAWSGSDAAALVWLPPLKPFFEVLAAGSPK